MVNTIAGPLELAEVRTRPRTAVGWLGCAVVFEQVDLLAVYRLPIVVEALAL